MIYAKVVFLAALMALDLYVVWVILATGLLQAFMLASLLGIGICGCLFGSCAMMLVYYWQERHS